MFSVARRAVFGVVIVAGAVRCPLSVVRGDEIPAGPAGENNGQLTTDHAQIPTPHSPLSPPDALAAFEVHPLVKVELAAVEPDVIDPVAVRFDERGRMWVAEMGDYPHGPSEGEPPRSRVRLLEDRDGDGYYETSRVFADQLLFLTGLQPWKGGLIVTLSGEVAWLADADGDGVADVRETWFAGFTADNPQLRANHPTFGPDNHVYVANGLRGGKVIATRNEWKAGAQPVSISGMDFRFDPESGAYAAVAGNGQFGLTFDAFGNRFVCSNRNPCIHVVLEDRYVRRNPHFAIDSVVHDVSPAGEQSQVFALSRAWTTSNLHAGQFTAACGVTIYNGDLLPAEFRGNSFTCEPTGNLVHRDILSPDGATFTSHPGREGVEFLATRDEWFRPVNLSVGPDGALYVVDMYRAVIEHPAWMPTELRNRADLLEGRDRGRIYRIVPAEARPHESDRLPAKRTDVDLVRLLEHENSWHRETAARLIFERQDAELRQPLEELAIHGKTPQSRVQALWALDGFGALDRAVVARALGDPHPRVREQAVRLAERLLENNSNLRTRLIELLGEADPRLRFQLVLSLGEAPWDDALRDAFSQTAQENADDPWLRKALVSSAGENAAVLLERLLQQMAAGRGATSGGMIQSIGTLSEVVAARQDAGEIGAVLSLLGRLNQAEPGGAAEDCLPIPLSALAGLGSGLNRRGKALQPFIETLDSTDAKNISVLFRRAVDVARDSDAALDLRLNAIRALRHASYETVGSVLESLTREEPLQDARVAAIESLAAFHGPEVGSCLTSGFSAQTPAVRRVLLSALFTDDSRIRMLLDEIDAGRIAPAEIDLARGDRLLKHRDADIRERASRLLATPADREQVLDKFREALSLKGNARAGRELFAKSCAACHRIGDVGVNVAPDIGDSRDRTPESLLTDILDPNRAIDSNYFSYTMLMLDGKQHTGIVSSETATSITLRQQEGKTQVLLREDVEELRSTGVSLMPVGLEKDISPAQMADLIAFIKHWRYLDDAIPVELE